MRTLLSFLSLFVGFWLLAFAAAGPIAPTQLTVEYLSSPVLGLDVLSPRFAWTPLHSDRNQTQTAYQVVVVRADDPLNLTSVVLDTGKVSSSQTSHVELPWESASGDGLASDSSYAWTVQWWDSSDQASNASEPAFFSTGALTEQNTTSPWWADSQWIGSGRSGAQLRSEFQVPGQPGDRVVRAQLYIVGAGYYVAYLNGQRVGQNYLGPFTTYEVRMLYDVYDVTDLISSATSSSALGVVVGNGWYAQPTIAIGTPAVRLQLSVTTCSSSGSCSKSIALLSSVSGWKTIAGPVTSDDIYIGEDYDARLETPGWTLAGYDDSQWQAPSNPSVIPSGALNAQLMPPIQKIDQYTPLSVSEPTPGTYVFDFGQNMAGWSKIKILNPPAGVAITLQHSEIIDQNGNVINVYSNSPMIDTYTTRGEFEVEEYEPLFVYHGFRYVAVTGFPGIPPLDSLQAFFVHSAMRETGEVVFSSPSTNFSSPSRILNAVQHATKFAAMSNFQSIPTDCPQRERRGWLGDAQLSSEYDIFNFDMAAAYTKFVRDIFDSQNYDADGGAVPDCVPFYGHGNTVSDPAWGTAYVVLWHTMYRYYGDTRILSDYYDGVKLYVDSLVQVNNPPGILPYTIYGDWCSVAASSFSNPQCDYPSPLVSTFYHLMNLETMASVAQLLGKSEDSANYESLAQQTRAAWNSYFYHPSSGNYQNGYQTDQLLSLYSNVVDPSNVDSVFNSIIQSIQTSNGHLNTGIVGTRFLFDVLDAYNRTDVGLELVTQTTYPSWGFWIEQGATTLWELWENTRYTTPGSLNHIMFGGQGSWYFKRLAGIANAGIAWNKIQFNPYVATNTSWSSSSPLTGVSAQVQVPAGQIVSEWQFVDSLCALVPEHSDLTLTCVSGTIQTIDFASFGLPLGECPSGLQINDQCHAANSTAIVQQECVGKSSCTIKAETTLFGDPCFGQLKRLAVKASGCTSTVYQHHIEVPVGSVGEVYFPSSAGLTVMESAQNIWTNGAFVSGVDGVLSAFDNGAQVIATVGSGSYDFQITY